VCNAIFADLHEVSRGPPVVKHFFLLHTHLNPVKTFSKEVFPAPDGPSIPVRRPELNFPQILYNIGL
jgi:hypothetical protein